MVMMNLGNRLNGAPFGEVICYKDMRFFYAENLVISKYQWKLNDSGS